MDYLVFDGLALALPALVLVLRSRRRVAWPAAVGLALLALAWTAPWDDHLVRSGVWTYAPHAVLARFGAVPAEEYLFVVLEVVLVAAWGLNVPARTAGTRGSRRAGAVGWAAVGLAGVVLMATGGHWRYAGLLLAWASGPLALQHAVAGDALSRQRSRRAAIAVPVVVWLCVADRLALACGIWSISPSSSLGIDMLGLPLEEAAFFALTCLLVTDGLLLGSDPLVLARVGALLRHRRRGAGARADEVPAQVWVATRGSRCGSPGRPSRRAGRAAQVDVRPARAILSSRATASRSANSADPP
ncbi:MAG: hypothetical protein NVS3B26_19870 [Mycobacteriales bacterium]